MRRVHKFWIGFILYMIVASMIFGHQSVVFERTHGFSYMGVGDAFMAGLFWPLYWPFRLSYLAWHE